MSDLTAAISEELASKLAYYLVDHDGRKSLSLKLAERVEAHEDDLLSVFIALHEAFMAARSAFYEAEADETDNLRKLDTEADKAYDKAAQLLLPVFRCFLTDVKEKFETAVSEYNSMATSEEQAAALPKVDDLYNMAECLQQSIPLLLPSAPPTPAACGGGGGGGAAEPAEPAEPAVMWASIVSIPSISNMVDTELISGPASFTEARKKAMSYLTGNLPANAAPQACRNRPWRDDVHGAGRTRVLKRTHLEEAFPASEEPVEEFFDVSVFRGNKLMYSIMLFPSTSYVWGNCQNLWLPKDDDEDRYDEDRYDDDDDYRGGYSDDERYGPRGCTCDASEPPIRGHGPVFCCCRDREDY
jgi:hypothetical protein